jgi:hypothetical protein
LEVAMKIRFMSFAAEDTPDPTAAGKDTKFHAGLSDSAGERSRIGVYRETSTE